MPTTDLLYSARATGHECLERGRDNLLKQPMYDAGALVAPTAGTVSIYNAAGVVLVSAAAVTITASVAQYTLAAATLATELLGEGWSIVWSLAMPDGTTRTIRRAASLVRSRLHPPAIAADLFTRVRALDPSDAHPITRLTLAEYDGYLDTCWLQIEDRLLRRGRRPWLVISSEALRELHIVGTLALIFEDLGTRTSNANHQERAKLYREQWRVEWAETRFSYNESDELAVEHRDGSAVGASSTTWLMSFGDPRSNHRFGG